MKKNISLFILLSFLNQFFFPLYGKEGETKQLYGVIYLGSPNQKQAKAFKVLEKRTKNWIENGPYGRVQISFLAETAAENELTLEQLRVQLVDSTRMLKKAVLESTDKSKGEKTLQEMKRVRKKMNLIGRFGPLLQKSYLTEAAYLWKNEKFTLSETALKKAIELDPMGKPLLEDWDMFSDSFGTFAFEKELARVCQKNTQFCETHVSVKENNIELKVNGFEMGKKRDVRLAVNSMHVLSVKSEKGRVLESVLHCLKKSHKAVNIDLSKSTSLTSEITLLDALNKSDAQGLFLTRFKKDALELYFYSKKGGITPIPLEKTVTQSELLEASPDFSFPISYANLNKILVNHFGTNALLVSSTGKESIHSLEYEKVKKSRNQWYNNSILWGVLGGLAVGAGATYVLGQ